MEIIEWKWLKDTTLKKETKQVYITNNNKKKKVKEVIIRKGVLFTYLRSYSNEEMERTTNSGILNQKASPKMLQKKSEKHLVK